MSNGLPMSPWKSIWFQPRQTIRAIINYKSNYCFIILSWLYAFPMLLNAAQSFSLITAWPLSLIIGGSFLLATFAGMLGIFLVSALLYWTGQWIGGTAPFSHVRAAVAWSNVPNIVTILSWFALIALFKGSVFLETFPQMQFVGGDLAAVFLIFLLQAVAGIWGFVILLHMIGEVQGFSAWRAFLNVIIAFVVVSIGLWVLMWVVSLFTNGATA